VNVTKLHCKINGYFPPADDGMKYAKESPPSATPNAENSSQTVTTDVTLMLADTISL